MAEVQRSIRKKIELKIRGSVFTEKKMKDGWKAPIAFYAFSCDRHGIVENYEQGYHKNLRCPICQDEAQEIAIIEMLREAHSV
jgi:hypothetical protein